MPVYLVRAYLHLASLNAISITSCVGRTVVFWRCLAGPANAVVADEFGIESIGLGRSDDLGRAARAE